VEILSFAINSCHVTALDQAIMALLMRKFISIQPYPITFKRSLNICSIGITVVSSGTMGMRPASAKTTAVLGSNGKTLIRSTRS